MLEENNFEQRQRSIRDFLGRFIQHTFANLLFLLLMTLQVSVTRMWRFQYPFAVFVFFHGALFYKKARLYSRRREVLRAPRPPRSDDEEEVLEHAMMVLLREIICEMMLVSFYLFLLTWCTGVMPLHGIVALFPLFFAMIIRFISSKWPVMPCESLYHLFSSSG